MMDFNNQGIAKRWRSRNAVIARLKKINPEHGVSKKSLENIKLYNLRRERLEEGPVEGIVKKGPVAIRNWKIVRYAAPHQSYARYSSALACQALGGALNQGKHWVERYNKAVSYKVLNIFLQVFFHYQFYCMRVSEGEPRHYQFMTIEDVVRVMADLFFLGRIEEAVCLGRLTHSLITRDEFFDLTDEFHRRAQFFMLRLFSQSNGLEREWPEYAYDEPVYEWLLEHWKESDPEALVPALLAACDRHTHQSWDDTTKANHDFHNVTMYRYPAEILMLCRLRELEGLENPVLDHPLCEAPFDRLPEPQEPYDDDILRGTLKRVREDWPNYDAILDEAAAYPMREPAYDMGRLHEFD